MSPPGAAEVGAGPTIPRPAWYALDRGGWRDYVTLLHPPYTAWHLSYVVIGGCLAPSWRWDRLSPPSSRSRSPSGSVRTPWTS